MVAKMGHWFYAGCAADDELFGTLRNTAISLARVRFTYDCNLGRVGAVGIVLWFEPVSASVVVSRLSPRCPALPSLSPEFFA